MESTRQDTAGTSEHPARPRGATLTVTDLRTVVPQSGPRLAGHRPHRHQVPELIYVVAGRAEVKAAGVSHRLSAREALWLSPGVLHSTRYADEGMAFGALLSDSTRPAGEVQVIAPMPRLDSLMRTILAAAPVGEQQIAPFRDALDALLCSLGRPHFTLRRPRHPAARRVADADPTEPVTLSDLARREAISLRQLQRIFADETGLSAARWRRRARLNLAVTAIRSGRSLAGAARNAGYSGRSSMVRALARETGLSEETILADPVAAVERSLESAAQAVPDARPADAAPGFTPR